MVKYYLPFGKVQEESHANACAKSVWNENSRQWIHYIKYLEGGFLDPFARETSLVRDYQWAKVKEEVFEHYINFLTTGHRSNLSYAERSM